MVREVYGGNNTLKIANLKIKKKVYLQIHKHREEKVNGYHIPLHNFSNFFISLFIFSSLISLFFSFISKFNGF